MIYGRPRLVRFLIEAGANANVEHEYDCRRTPLYIALEGWAFSFDMVKTLVENGNADVNAKIKYRALNYVLHMAVYCHDDAELLKYLIFKGADPNVFDELGETPLDVTLRLKKYDLMRILIKGGANSQHLHVKGCRVSLNKAVYDDDEFKRLKKLLNEGKAEVVSSKTSMTPIERCAYEENRKFQVYGHMATWQLNQNFHHDFSSIQRYPQLNPYQSWSEFHAFQDLYWSQFRAFQDLYWSQFQALQGQVWSQFQQFQGHSWSQFQPFQQYWNEFHPFEGQSWNHVHPFEGQWMPHSQGF